jgi:hypothetical protein
MVFGPFGQAFGPAFGRAFGAALWLAFGLVTAPVFGLGYGCGAPLGQAHTGRKRRYCSDACRRAADDARWWSRPAPAKPQHCRYCGRPITQQATGPRKTCAGCRTP